MSNSLAISLIIPVYNVEAYLRQCLDSILSQTLEDIEVICINDGSTDDSLEILREYANRDKRIFSYLRQTKVLLLQEILGLKKHVVNSLLL